MAKFENNEHFQYFVKQLDNHIVNYGLPKDKEGFYKAQKAQVEGLVKLEKQFRRVLIDSQFGSKVYKAFITYILEVKKNILSARPFFRERQEVFTEFISGSIKNKNEKALFRFNINYQFIHFAVKAHKWPRNGKIMKLYNEIKELRTAIAELNTPLAISRAKIFWACTPKSQLSYMDLVQTSCEGLLAAIDKFVPPCGKVFRAVIIGRSLGNMIEGYSETLLHFYPNDKRKIYRANKAVRHLGGVNEADFEELTTKVNEGMEDANKTNPVELRELMGAASTVSSDSTISMDGDKENIVQLTAKFPATEDSRPDVLSEKKDLNIKLAEAIAGLSLLEQKLLKMKGVTL